MTTSTQQTELYFDPYDFDLHLAPYETWRRLRDEAPLYHNEKYDFYTLSRWVDVEAGLKDTERLSSARGTLLELIRAGVEMPAGMMIFDDPPVHSAYRSLLSRVFTPRRMGAIEPQVRQLAASLLDPWVGAGELEVIDVIGRELPMRVISTLLGIPEEHQRDVRAMVDDSLRLERGEMDPAEMRERMTTQLNQVHDQLMESFVDERTTHPRDDLLSELIHAEFEDHTGTRRRLTRDEVLGYLRLLAAAGNETTTKLIGWTVKLLGEYPEQRRAIAADRSLVPQAIEEILRLESPSPNQCRYVTRDTEWYGRVVPKGSIVMLMNASANRDQRHWGPTADELDIHRRIDHHLAFGYGPHFCLGAALARMEGRVVLDEFIARFPDWEPVMDRAVFAHTSTVRGWASLPVRIG